MRTGALRFVWNAGRWILREVPVMNKQELAQVLMENTAYVLSRIKEGSPYKVREVEFATNLSKEKRTMTIDLEDGTTLIVMLWEPIEEDT
jgi:hypothetical protein